MKIVVAGNGPSAITPLISEWLGLNPRIFRTNYFTEMDYDPLNYNVHDWFVCQNDPGDYRVCTAFLRGYAKGLANCGVKQKTPGPVFWIPGIEERSMPPHEVSQRLHGAHVRVQKWFPHLPVACRWQKDLSPERPLMGSVALAVAVGMQPAEIYICGLDLFQHPGGMNHAGLDHDTRPWQAKFDEEYLANKAKCHTLRGDLKYIRAALEAYGGKVICVGSVMKRYFADDFKKWEWLEG